LGIAAQEPDSLPFRDSLDQKSLIFESAVLSAEMEVTGHPLVKLFVSSTADDGDFFVYLSDVDQSGKALLVTEGQLRAGFSTLYDNDIMIKTHPGIDVRPDLPWHGYEKAHYHDKILANGSVVELLIDFQPTSWVFKKGHQIRLSITCADYPTYRLHPKLAPNNKSDDPENMVPEITVYCNAEYPSMLTLPVIPQK
jgi:putative CocE/NonD family hydrolase